MVEEVRRQRPSENDNIGAEEEIVKLSHFPKDGGVKELVVTKSSDGAYFLRLGTYSRGKRDVQTMKLDEKEMAYVVMRLFRAIWGGV